MARSAAMMAIINNGIDINEYSAKEIKRAVTGRGGSSKEQVSFMMKAILDIKENPEYYDSTDALAIAVCHYNNASTVIGKNTNWKTFIKNNPHLIIDLNKNKKIK
jgi:crossover junction endodeoxyribonuclease RuvC